MKTEEFSLSDKRKELSNYGLESTESLGGAAKFYREDDVKEFIRILKMILRQTAEVNKNNRGVFDCCKGIDAHIDNLAGDKLK